MLKVCKFGGSSLADAARVRQVCSIVMADRQRRVVVVSAPGKRTGNDTKVTDLLLKCANNLLAGKSPARARGRVMTRFRQIIRELRLEPLLLDSFEQQLDSRLAADRQCRGSFTDGVIALGEDFSAQMVAAALRRQGAAAAYVNPREAGMLLTSEHGAAQLVKSSYKRLAGLKKREEIVVFPGFFGYSKSGAVVTFPRGGSDITGAILAASLEADEYENFTDVDRVMVVDPRIVPGVSHSIGELTYREMRELAYAGFGVFHEEAVLPAIMARIPIHVRNTARPELEGTRVVPSRQAETGSIVGIASADGFCCIYVDKFLMNREIGFGRRLLRIFEDEGVSYEHTPSGIDNISVIVEQNELKGGREARVLRRIRRELKPDALLIERNHALIMVVGEGMHYMAGLAARATGALAEAGINIEMMNQGASEISMMFGVRSADLERSVKALYRAFFQETETKE